MTEQTLARLTHTHGTLVNFCVSRLEAFCRLSKIKPEFVTWMQIRLRRASKRLQHIQPHLPSSNETEELDPFLESLLEKTCNVHASALDLCVSRVGKYCHLTQRKPEFVHEMAKHLRTAAEQLDKVLMPPPALPAQDQQAQWGEQEEEEEEDMDLENWDGTPPKRKCC